MHIQVNELESNQSLEEQTPKLNTEKKLHLKGQKGRGKLPTGGRELCIQRGQRSRLLPGSSHKEN